MSTGQSPLESNSLVITLSLHHRQQSFYDLQCEYPTQVTWYLKPRDRNRHHWRKHKLKWKSIIFGTRRTQLTITHPSQRISGNLITEEQMLLLNTRFCFHSEVCSTEVNYCLYNYNSYKHTFAPAKQYIIKEIPHEQVIFQVHTHGSKHTK